MSGLLLVTALAHALREDAPDRDAVWSTLQTAVAEGRLLFRRHANQSPDEIQTAIRKAISRENLRPGWLEACETALLQSPKTWVEYVDSLGAEVPPASRLEKILRLRSGSSGPFTAPIIAGIFSILDETRQTLLAGPTTSPGTQPITKTTSASSTGQSTCSVPQNAFLTRSQQTALTRLRAMAEIYFTLPAENVLRPKLTPLLIAATGSGKTALASRVAEATGAHLLRFTIGTWIPAGARETSTIRRLGQALSQYDRVVLLIDEVDKLATDTSNWNRSCLGEVFDLLERECPPQLSEKDSDRTLYSRKIRTSLFILAAGTWEHLHVRRTTTRALGFGAPISAPCNTTQNIAAGAIKEGFPAELMGRFHRTPIYLDYPDATETQELFEKLGLNALAQTTGRTDLITKFDWAPYGLRALESLYADLLIARHQQRSHEVVPDSPDSEL